MADGNVCGFWGIRSETKLLLQGNFGDDARWKVKISNVVSEKSKTSVLVYASSRSQVILLSAGDGVAGLPLLRQHPRTATCGAPPQSLLPQRHRVGRQRHGDELSGRQEHCPAGLPPLEQADGHGGPERPDAQDQDWTMTWPRHASAKLLPGVYM